MTGGDWHEIKDKLPESPIWVKSLQILWSSAAGIWMMASYSWSLEKSIQKTINVNTTMIIIIVEKMNWKWG